MTKQLLSAFGNKMFIINPYRFAGASTLLDGLIPWWELNEEGGNRSDSHGSLTLTDNNTVGFAAGKVGNAADFEVDNLEDLTNISASVLAPGTSDLTIAFWFNTESAVNPNRFVTLATGSSGIFVAGHTATGDVTFGENSIYVIWTRAAGNDVPRHTANTSLGVWAFCLIDYDHSELEVNIALNNGTPQATAVAGQLNAGIDNIYMAAHSSGDTRNFDGMLDEFAIWHRLLTTGEKAALYNSGSGIGYPG